MNSADKLMPDPNGPISILHLEDNPLDAELTMEIMAEAGIECTLKRMVRLEDFREALENYPANWSYDMVLADYKMPGYDGMMTLKMLRQVDPHIPFILLSGALGEELAVEVLRNGATDYVLKHNLQRLPLVIRRAMAEHHGRLREMRNQEELRRARDEAEKANSAKGRFLGRISHELRTPLNAILGYTQLIQADPMSEEQKHCADQILKAGEHLLQLINEVLDITRIESGTFSVNIVPTSLTRVIERAVDLVRPMTRERSITIHLDCGPCDIFAMVDQDRLAQVLLNLLTNAIKYNDPHGHVYVECQKEESDNVRILVRDTGIGISDQKLDRLFTPFDRLDAERETTIPGTGLGLTVSKALVEAMGGEIGVHSSPGSTEFWLTFPAALVPEISDSEMENSPLTSTVEDLLPDCSILLVEDHPPSRDYIERVFARRCQVQLHSVPSVDEAVAWLDNSLPQLIVTDLNFPDRPGEDLIRHVKTDPRLKDIPIIVTTIDPSPERTQKLKEMGIADYFIKPFRINAFLSSISRHALKSSQ